MTVVEPPVKGQLAQPTAPANTSTKRKVLYGLLAALVVAVVVAVPVTVTQFAVHTRNTRGTSPVSTSGSGSLLTEDYCSKLYGDSKTYCRSYLKSTGPNKFMAASIWLQVSQATRKRQLFSHITLLSTVDGIVATPTAVAGSCQLPHHYSLAHDMQQHIISSDTCCCTSSSY